MTRSSHLIRTKLHPPPAETDLVEMDRLYARLEEQRRPLCLVCGAAGYGKSTVIGGWLRRAGHPYAWVSLDARDNDLGLFVSYVVEALRESEPTACRVTLALVESPSAPDPEALAGLFVNEVSELAKPPVLVLDDYHRIHLPEIHHFVRRIIEHPPAGFRLVLSSRSEPPLPLARLRANALLTEIRAEDLCFDLTQTSRFLDAAVPERLSDTAVEQLHHTTEGWPAGLRLAATILRGGTGGEALASLLLSEQKNVRDYLIEEVFSQQPQDLRTCLLELSVLERFNAGLAHAVLSEPPPSDLFEALVRSGLPMVRLDDRGEWVRFHHLLGSFLRTRLRETSGAGHVAELRRRATRALEAQGLVDEAFDQALQEDDPAEAAALLVRQRAAMVRAERWSDLDRWLRRMPEAAPRDPRLMLLRAWVCENRARFSELFLMLDAIEESLASAVAAGAPVDPQVRGEVLALRSFQRVLESRPAASAECAARALELLPKACVSERGYAYIVLSGALQMTGAASRARDVLYEALAAMGDSQGTAYQSRIVAGLGYVAWMEADGDRLGQAGRLCVELGERHELPESQLYGRYMLSLSQYQADDLESAEATLSGLAAPELMENAGGYAAATLVSAATHQASGRWDAAVGVVDELVEHLLRRGDTPVLRWVESYRALLLARQGNVRAALAWLRGEPGVDRLPPYLCHSAMLVAPRILLEDGTEASLEAAAEHLDDVVPYLKELHNARFLAEALGLEAWLRLARGDHRGARRALEDAVRLVLPGGLVRVLADVGPALHPLLEDLKGKGELRVFVDRVLSAGRRGRPAGREESGEELVLPLPRPLTKRETEVLSLMAQDLGNRDIARRLYISPATVKRHSENLYAKLGATGRREAVALARRRGLLRTSTGAN